MSIKDLPITDPPLTTYPGYADTLAILMSHPEAFDWVFSNYIQLYATQIIVNDFNHYFPTTGYAPSFFGDFDNRRLVNMMSDTIFLDREKCPHLNVFEAPLALIENNEHSIVDFIRKCIDLEMYIYGYADITSIHNYRVRNPSETSFHPVFVFGYDDEKRRFHVGEFLLGRKYHFTWFDYDEVELAFRNIKNYELLRVKSISLIQYVSNASFLFRFESVRKCISEYLNPTCESSLNLTEYSTSFFAPLDWHTHSFIGIDVYNFLEEFLSVEIALKLQRFDLRPFHALFDHKSMMVKRIQYFIEQGYLKKPISILEHFEKIKKDTEIARNLIIKRNRLLDDAIVERIPEILQKTKEQETALLRLTFDV